MIQVWVEGVPVVIARGKRPVTFRTRKLSLSAPMVLQGGPCGRVGRRRTQRKKMWPSALHRELAGETLVLGRGRWPFLFSWANDGSTAAAVRDGLVGLRATDGAHTTTQRTIAGADAPARDEEQQRWRTTTSSGTTATMTAEGALLVVTAMVPVGVTATPGLAVADGRPALVNSNDARVSVGIVRSGMGIGRSGPIGLRGTVLPGRGFRVGDRGRVQRPSWDRPSYSSDRPRRDGDRPSYNSDRPRRDGDRPSYNSDRPRRDGDRPSYNSDRSDRPRS